MTWKNSCTLFSMQYGCMNILRTIRAMFRCQHAIWLNRRVIQLTQCHIQTPADHNYTIYYYGCEDKHSAIAKYASTALWEPEVMILGVSWEKWVPNYH